MTSEERQMLTDLANKIAQTPAPPIDKEAEDFIRMRIGSRPDALYLMTQTVLIQNMAIEQARQQIQQLQQASPAPASQSGSSFLGGGSSPRPSQSGYSSSQYASQPSSQPPPPTYQTVPVGPGGTQAPGAGSTFLRGAAQTAAGVAAGALAFEGIRSLFGGVEHFAGFGGGGGMFGGGGIGGYGRPEEETVINNYYDSPEQQASSDRDDGSDRDGNIGQDTDVSQDYDNTGSDDSGDYSDDGSGSDFLA